MARPWHTLPPLLVEHARAIRLLRLTTVELRDLNQMPPPEVRCWRTTPEGRQWQAALTAALTPPEVS